MKKGELTPTRTTFSGAFQTGAIYTLSTPSILFNIFMNIALYLLFTVCCFFTARPPRFLCALLNPYLQHPRLPAAVRRVVGLKRMGRRQTVAVCFCGAAKTTSLGIPLVTAMWKDADDLTRAFIQIPVLLYTIEQVRFESSFQCGGCLFCRFPPFPSFCRVCTWRTTVR